MPLHGQNDTGQNAPDKMPRDKMPLNKMPPDKMPPTVECFFFIFFESCFSLLLYALNEAANCLKRRKIELYIIAKFYSKYQTPTYYL